MTLKMITLTLTLLASTSALEMLGSRFVRLSRACASTSSPEWAPQSASDGGSLVVVAGADPGPGEWHDELDCAAGGDAADSARGKLVWMEVLTGDGSVIRETDATYHGATAPTFAAQNAKTGDSAVLASTADSFALFLAEYRVWDGPHAGLPAYSYDGPDPAGLAVLNPAGLVAILSRDAVTVYEAVDSSEYDHGGYTRGGWLVARSTIARNQSGWREFKQVAFDPFSADGALYVGGTLDAGDRAVAKIDVEGAIMDVAWTASAGADDGTPRLHLRRTEPRAAATEVLLLSKKFYARLDAADGSRAFLREADGLFLPEDGGARATYDATIDALYSTGDGTKVRKHRVDDGETIWERDVADLVAPRSSALAAADASPPRTAGIHATADSSGRSALHVVVVFSARGADDDADDVLSFETHVARFADEAAAGGGGDGDDAAAVYDWGAVNAWCSSARDDWINGPTSAAECWDACVAKHGDAVVAVDWNLYTEFGSAGPWVDPDQETWNGWGCWCQDSCPCVHGLNSNIYTTGFVLSSRAFPPEQCADDYESDESDDDDDDDDDGGSIAAPDGCVSWFDGCNTCALHDDGWACTEMWCEPDEMDAPACLEWEADDDGGSIAPPDGCVSWFDGCNRCALLHDDEWACTNMWCEPDEKDAPACLEWEADDDDGSIAAPDGSIDAPDGCARWYDGCNVCVLDDRDVWACDDAICRDKLPYPGQCLEWNDAPIDGCVKYWDGCNTCELDDSDMWACSDTICYGLTYPDVPWTNECLEWKGGTTPPSTTPTPEPTPSPNEQASSKKKKGANKADVLPLIVVVVAVAVAVALAACCFCCAGWPGYDRCRKKHVGVETSAPTVDVEGAAPSKPSEV